MLILPIAAVLLLLPGIALALIPSFPAIAYMLLVSVLYGWADGFDRLSGGEIGLLAAITAVAFIVDQLSGALGARWGGASGKSMLAAAGGAILGSVLIPPFGGFIGVFVAVLAAEIYQGKERRLAAKAAAGGVLGSVIGTLSNVALAIVFFIAFLAVGLR